MNTPTEISYFNLTSVQFILLLMILVKLSITLCGTVIIHLSIYLLLEPLPISRPCLRPGMVRLHVGCCSPCLSRGDLYNSRYSFDCVGGVRGFTMMCQAATTCSARGEVRRCGIGGLFTSAPPPPPPPGLLHSPSHDLHVRAHVGVHVHIPCGLHCPIRPYLMRHSFPWPLVMVM
jgi:hypothetical protein